MKTSRATMSDGARVFAELLAPGSEANAHAQFDARVAGRRVLLGNADRAATHNDDQGIGRRAARLRRKARRQGALAKKKARKSVRGSRERHLPGKELKYEDALALHDLWKEYMRVLLNLHQVDDHTTQNVSWISNIQSTLLKADWTGAHMRVVQATNPSLVHSSGIVAQETHETFVLVSATASRTIPKRNCVFSVEIEITLDKMFSVELHGNQLRYTMPARATRKHKARRTVELE